MLSGYDTSSFPYSKGRVSSLNTKVSGNYQCLATIDGVCTTHTELMNAVMLSLLHYTVSKQEHPWNLLATIYVERRREILKRWLYLKTSANLTQQYILGLILKISHVVESSTNKKVLQASQTNITYLTCEFGDVCIYRSLLKVFLLHSTDLM